MAVVNMTDEGGFGLHEPTVAYRLVVNVALVSRWPANRLAAKCADQRVGAWPERTTRLRSRGARGVELTTRLTTKPDKKRRNLALWMENRCSL